ncbi:germination lipoprotein GerS-related protein [Clostridium paraputrificum]|uniref:germination lipoprotein GerS-related protein n=1 Tax=Clostridium paraputrificum TaxID=29363 RepID=UPI003D33629B
MKSEMQFLKNIKGKKWMLLLLLIPFISIILIITFRHTYAPTNEEIIEKIKKIDAYNTKAEYIIKNTKSEYKEETNMYYCKDIGMRIEFGEDRVKIYKDGFVSMNDNGDEYEIKENFDTLYPLAFYNNILNNEIKEVKEGAEEWGDIKYLEVDVSLPSKNKHISSAKVYINKEDKSPIITKIFDIDGKERVTIIYKNFKELKEIDRGLF